MEKLILNDGTELKIEEGASIGAITVKAEDFTKLGEIACSLLEDGALDLVKFETNGNVSGVYKNMRLESPLFRSVDIVNDKVRATFVLREKTEMELAIEELQRGQKLQDDAIADLGDVVSEISEGSEE